MTCKPCQPLSLKINNTSKVIEIGQHKNIRSNKQTNKQTKKKKTIKKKKPKGDNYNAKIKY